METLLDAPAEPAPAPTPAPAPAQSVRHVSPEEQEQIFERADELDARIAAILEAYG